MQQKKPIATRKSSRIATRKTTTTRKPVTRKTSTPTTRKKPATKKTTSATRKPATKIIDINEKNWLIHANFQYDTWKQYKQQYRNIIKKNKHLEDLEQFWVDMYLQPVINFMGDYGYWHYFQNLQNLDVQESKTKMPEGRYSARFSTKHWTAKKPGDVKYFDPYHEYQYQGSNQFCQTFVLMYLSGFLPTPIYTKTKTEEFKKYYSYSLSALNFIKMYIIELQNMKGFSKNDRNDFNINLIRVNVLLKYPNATVNCIELGDPDLNVRWSPGY